MQTSWLYDIELDIRGSLRAVQNVLALWGPIMGNHGLQSQNDGPWSFFENGLRLIMSYARQIRRPKAMRTTGTSTGQRKNGKSTQDSGKFAKRIFSSATQRDKRS